MKNKVEYYETNYKYKIGKFNHPFLLWLNDFPQFQTNGWNYSCLYMLYFKNEIYSGVSEIFHPNAKAPNAICKQMARNKARGNLKKVKQEIIDGTFSDSKEGNKLIKIALE